MRNTQHWIHSLIGYCPGKIASSSNSEFEKLRENLENAQQAIYDFLHETNKHGDDEYCPTLSDKEILAVGDFLTQNFSSENKRALAFSELP